MNQKQRFKTLLETPGIIAAPGAYDCLTAKIIENSGFSAVYMTGAGTSVAKYGYPDLALTTATEMISSARDICSIVDIPVIADADTGYGGILNVQRTIRDYERSGVAAVHLEDQEFPKRCGHLDGKQVIETSDMVSKIKAAVDARDDPNFTLIVRTDALAVTSWDDTIDRCWQYIDAGADALFVEALRSRHEVEAIAKLFPVPMLYNFVETGKSPLYNIVELEDIGFKIVIYPVSALLTVCNVVSNVMNELKQFGSTGHLVENMLAVSEAFDMVGLSDMLQTSEIYNPQA
ncbi:MAG: carboxyvinyl-carboxyphosphonate phosphorylmutase [Dehalococcoidia bacterium]|nr:carboxyvinyl-carboxyphosphonate phosphorylmutase [Dehalococcoidia bacterium]|tara:strand:+ start:4889 stop:5758 length:870 start_codon:yes stop_codon:yes gene_type:complete